MAALAVETLQRLNASAPATLADRAKKARLVGERKPVTAVFADIVGSTSLAENIDPEDWTVIINSAFDEMSQRIFDYEGTIAQLQGDAIISFFGAPVAHEDDPERAVRAARAMIESMSAFGAEMKRTEGIDFQIRIGISTGLVLVGNVGSDLRYDYTAIGDTMNLAARLETAASPGEILISGATQRFVEPFFELEDVGGLDLKGKAEPVPAFRVVAERSKPLATRGIEGLDSPMVGRAAELAELEQLVATTQAGRGRVAVIIGEPGLGKSRLVAELRASATSTAKTEASARSDGADAAAESDGADGAGREVAWVTGHASSYGRQMPFHLVTSLIRDVLGVGPSNSNGEVDAALRSTLAQYLAADTDADAYGLLAYLLGLPVDTEEAGRVDLIVGDLLEERLTSAVVRLIRAISRQGPLVVSIEDLHWADTASAEIIKGLLTVPDEAPVLVVCTTRDESESPGWSVVRAARERMGRALSEIRLEPLERDDSAALVANLLEIESLSHRTRSLILEKAEGNPFFVEEVIRMLIDHEMIERRGDRWVATGPVDDLEIPDTVHGLILARVDRQPEDARRVLRLASCIDRRFAVPLLEDVAGSLGIADGIGSALRQLEAAELLVLDAAIPELEYRFSHSLVQDAAYETVLRQERRAWHLLVAQALLARYPDREDELSDQLARHYEQAGDAERAVHYFLISGHRALARAATHDARDLYRRASTLLESATEPGSDETLRLRLAVNLGRIATEGGFATNDEIFALLEEALPLAERLDDPVALADMLFWETLFRRGRGETPDSSPRLAQALQRLEQLGDVGDDVQRSLALFQSGLMLWFAGDFDGSREALVQASSIMRARGDMVGAAMAEGYLAANYATEGAFDKAEQSMAASRELSDQADELSRLDYHIAESSIAALRGDYATSQRYASECVEAANEMGALACAMVSGVILGGAQMGMGEGAEARATLERSLELAMQGYMEPLRHRADVYLASASGMAGDLAGAESGFRSALAGFVAFNSPYGQAETQLFRGLVQAHHPDGDPQAALSDLEPAIATFESLGAAPALARALRTRGMVLARLGRKAEADADLARSAAMAQDMGLVDAPWPPSATALQEMRAAESPLEMVDQV